LNNLPRQVNEYDITVPQHFILPIANTWDYVSGSPTCEIFISGDVAGPYFLLGYDEWLNTDNLIQRTTAPADSGVFDFAMMIYNLRYMLQGKYIIKKSSVDLNRDIFQVMVVVLLIKKNYYKY
jgi:hypothetical protein